MDKRILIGMTLVVMLCVGAWWFVSPAKKPVAAGPQPTSATSQEIGQSPAAKLAPTELTPAIPESDTQRATAAEPAPIAATVPTAETALVKVLVLDKTTHDKMPGVRVSSSDNKKLGHAWGDDNGLSRGKLWDTLRTDAEGRAEIEAPAHEELIVNVSGDRVNAGYATKTVASLEPGTTTEIVLEIPKGDDLPFWMKLVDESTHAPLIGASVSLVDRGQECRKIQCDAQGLAFVSARSWTQTQLQVHAPGRPELYLESQRGHERIEDAFVIALPLCATLRAHVVDGNGSGIAAARVVLKMPGYQLQYSHDIGSMTLNRPADPRWEGGTDANGVATIEGLPPRVPIKASIESPKPWTSAQDLSFESGETRNVDWKLTSGCQVRGVLLDQNNAPVVARRVSLRKADRKKPTYFTSTYSDDGPKTISDQQGRFAFENVSPGTWWVGPSAVERDKKPSLDDVAALAQVVEVADGQDAVELTLHVDRGLLITGKVLDSKGAPVDSISLLAYDEKAQLATFAQSRDEKGEFVIGPLMAGRYAVTANSHGADAGSLPMELEAGAHDVVLQLRQGAVIAGTVVDDGGQPIPAVVCVVQRDTKFGMHTMSPRQDGSFRIQSLEPGTYQVSAHTSDGHIGVLENVEASVTEPPVNNVVHLRQGGHVRVRHQGPEKYCNVSVFQNGIELGGDGVALGASKDVVAPVGTVVVRANFHEANRTVERTVDVKAGETVDVVFEKDAH